MTCSIKILTAFLIPLVATLQIVRSNNNFRLPNYCAPQHYELSINLGSQIFTGDSDKFHGAVTILFSCNTSVDYVQLHADKTFINITTLQLNGLLIESNQYNVNNKTDILNVLATDSILAGSKNTLVITYTGKINNDVSGLYKSEYIDENGDKTYMVSTQFEPVHARKMFPCFDEPSLKATFHVEVTTAKTLKVFFNTKEKNIRIDGPRKISTFETTPPMSTYILALVVAKYDCTEAEKVNNVPFSICSRPGTSKWRELIKNYGPKLLMALNEFTGQDYGSYSKKMDLLAIPDLSFGAMENWGLVTFRENYLLWDANESSSDFEQEMVDIVAHEFAHQWFGNLVTLQWWSETYLNEGFATYFEFHITDKVVPDWELQKHFIVNIVQVALGADSHEDSNSLTSSCSTTSDINEKFGDISYYKGGSIINMVRNFMGDDNFRNGLRHYLQVNKEGNVTSQHLWNSLEKFIEPNVTKLPASLTQVMKNWIEKDGYPVLNVKLNDSVVQISQKRFSSKGTGSNNSKWYVPISYTMSPSYNTDSEKSSLKAWLEPGKDLELSVPYDLKWIILNNNIAGFYRVNYDDLLWDKISQALQKPNFDGIPDVNRAQITNDLFNLASANEIKYTKGLSILKFLSNDQSYYTWRSAIEGFRVLLQNTVANTVLHNAVKDDMLRLINGKLYPSISTDTKNFEHVYTLKQSITMDWSCRLGNMDCIQKVKELFKNYRNNGTKIPKNLKKAVFCNALRYSTDPGDWDFLWNKYLLTDLATEETTILNSLACTTDQKSLKKYLQKSIEDNVKLRKQDGLPIFQAVYREKSENADIVLNFIDENFEKMKEKYQNENYFGDLLEEMGRYLWKSEHIQKLIGFKELKNIPDDLKTSITSAIQSVKDGILRMDKIEDDLINYYGLYAAKNDMK